MNLEQLKTKLLKNQKTKKEFQKYDLAFELSEVLISLRLENGLTQVELAKRLHLKQSAIARLESGTFFPSFSTLIKLSKLYKLGISNIISRAEIPTKTKICDIKWPKQKTSLSPKNSITSIDNSPIISSTIFNDHSYFVSSL